MDGLLIDSEVLWHEAELEILGGLGVPLEKDGFRTTKGMFVHEVTEHWYGLHPWPGPSPADVAVSIVDRVIDLILTKGVLKPGAITAIDLCAARGWPLAVASRRSTASSTPRSSISLFGIASCWSTPRRTRRTASRTPPCT